MKTTKPATILLALVLLTAAAAQQAEKPEKNEISNTRTASCLFKITTTEAVLPLNDFAVDYLLRSSGVAGKAAREVLDISPDMASELFEIEEIESIYPDSAGGVGIPPGATVPAGTSPTTSRASVRPPTARTALPGSTSTTATTPTRRPPTRPTPTRTTTVTQPLPFTTEQTILLFRLHVGLPDDAKPAAEEFMNSLIDNLRSALRGAFDEYSEKLKHQLNLAAEEATLAEEELVGKQAELRHISGSHDLSRYAILRDISSLRQKLQTAKMEQASNKALMEATTKRIAQIEADLKEEIGKDRVTDELQRMFELQLDRLQRTKKLVQQGSVSSAELADAEEKLARARIELAKRREELSKSAGGDRINSLNQQLSDYSIQVTRAEAEILNLENQLTDAESLLAITDSYELLSLKMDIAKQNLEETLLWRARLGRNARSIQPPDVTVIGAE